MSDSDLTITSYDFSQSVRDGVVIRPRTIDAFHGSDDGSNDGLSDVSLSGHSLRRSAGHQTRTALPVRKTGHQR